MLKQTRILVLPVWKVPTIIYKFIIMKQALGVDKKNFAMYVFFLNIKILGNKKLLYK